MNLDGSTIIILAGFVILALASKQIGHFLTRFKLPLISGFLLAGIVIGPYGIGFLEAGDLESLKIVDEIALAFIAFAAGSELYLRELRSRVEKHPVDINRNRAGRFYPRLYRPLFNV